MLKFAAKILEFSDDDPKLAYAKIAANMPEFVNDAVVLDAKESDLVSDYDYGIIFYNTKGDKSRKYLLVDPGNVWLSAQYFLDKRDSWPKIAQAIIIRSILSKADKYGISKYPIFSKLREIKTSLEAGGIMKKVPEQNIYDEKLFLREQNKEEVLSDQQSRSGRNAKEPSEKWAKKASDNKTYALKPGDDVWVDRPMYDISTPELTKKASEYFLLHKNAMTLRTKRKFASAVLSQAEKLNADISPIVKQYGSDMIDKKMAYHSVMRRAHMCKEAHKTLAANIVHNIPNMSADELINCIDAFDKLAFTNDVSQFGIPDPVLSTTAMPAEDQVIYDSGAKQLTLRNLKKVVKEKKDKLHEVFDSKVVSSLESNPEKAFKALPTPYKKIIAGLTN